MAKSIPNPYEGDEYRVLDIPKSANRKEIRRAHRRILLSLRGSEETDRKQNLQFATDRRGKASRRALIDLVTLWEERDYQEILDRYAEAPVKLEVTENWELRRAFTEVTERDGVGSMDIVSPRVSWAPVGDHAKPPPDGGIFLDR